MAPPHTQVRRRKGVVYRDPKPTTRKPTTRKPRRKNPPKPTKPRIPLLDPSKNFRLKVGIDQGTKNSAAVYSIEDDDQASVHGYGRRSLNTTIASQFDFHIQSRVAVVRDPNSRTGKKWRLVFGSEIEQYEMLALSEDADAVIIDLVKMAIVRPDSSVWSTKEGAAMFRSIKNGHERLMTMLHDLIGEKVEVNVYSVLGEPVRICPIRTLATLTSEFLRYLREVVQKSVMSTYALSKTEGDFVMDMKADIAISVPAVCEDLDIDRLRIALNDAGYPETTCVLSEAKISALFKIIWELTDQGNHVYDLQTQKRKAEAFALKWCNTIMIIVDVGHGTTDLASIRIMGTWPFVEVGEVVPGSGSACGAYRPNILFKIFIEDRHAELLSNLTKEHRTSEGAVLESFSAGFEAAKCRFDPSKMAHTISYKLPSIDGESTIERKISVPTADLIVIFDQWVREISQLLLKQIKKTFDAGYYPSNVRVALSGGGSHSKYLRDYLETRHATIAFSHFEPANHPALAQGNLWALLNKAFCEQEFARASYGVKALVPSNEELHSDLAHHAKPTKKFGPDVQQEMRDRISWRVLKDENICKSRI